jgi:superfamily II DNA or RNA helicase
MALRDYQTECIQRIQEEFTTSDSTLCQLATGLGKTEIALDLAHHWPGRTIFMAHMDELIRQPALRYKRTFGDDAGIEKGELRVEEIGHVDDRFRLVVTSVQTMSRPKRSARFDPRDFGLLIVDEAHHSICRSYRQVFEYFRKNANLKILGITATPKRSDKLGLAQVFESVAFRYGIEPAIADGWLVPIRQQVIKVQGLDFSKVRTIKGDLDKEELEKILTEEEILHRVAAPAVQLCEDKPSLVFCVTVKHAECMMHVLNRYKPGSATYVSGNRKVFPLKTRHDILDKFRRGEVQFLCACNLLLEGFDAPLAANLVQARPTKSPVVYEQGLGRITRRYGVPEGIPTPVERRRAIASSPKPFGTVFDFVGNAGQHKIIQAVDILGGNFGMPIRAYAKKTMEEEDGVAVQIEVALDRADAEMALEVEFAEWERRRQVRANATRYKTADISPFAGGSVRVSPSQVLPKELPSSRVLSYIAFLARRAGQGDYWNTERLARLSKSQAGAIVAKLRREAGL